MAEIYSLHLNHLKYGVKINEVAALKRSIGVSKLASFLQFPIIYIIQYALGAAVLWLFGEQFSVSLELAMLGVIIVTILVTCLLSRFVLKHLLNESYVQ